MNPYTAIALSLRPRSWITAGASIAALIALIVVTRELQNRSAHELQLAIAAAALLLGVFGVALGSRIRQLRGWPAAVLVPGLLTKHTHVLGFALLVIWGIWLVASGISVTLRPTSAIPLASGVLGAWAGSVESPRRYLLVGLLFGAALLASVGVLPNDMGVALGSFAVAGIAWALLARAVNHPPTDASKRTAAGAWLLPGQTRLSQWLRDNAFERIGQGSTRRSVRLELALGFSPLMDWVSAFYLSLTVPLAMGLISLFDHSSPERLVVMAAVINTILVIGFAPLSLLIYAREFDRLWMMGFRSRVDLARDVIRICVGHSIRLALCSIIVISALGVVLTTEPLPDIIAFLTLAPAIAAVLIGVTARLRETRLNGVAKTIATYGSVAALLALQDVLLEFTSQWSPLTAVVLTLVVAGIVALVGIGLGANAMARQSFVGGARQ